MVENVAVEVRPGGLAIERPSDLPPGVTFSSATGKASLIFQYDGNLVQYDENRGVRFASDTAQDERGGNGGQTCRFQADGNLVVYNGAGQHLFASKTADDENGGSGGRILLVQDDGNVVIYDANNRALWATGANH